MPQILDVRIPAVCSPFALNYKVRGVFIAEEVARYIDLMIYVLSNSRLGNVNRLFTSFPSLPFNCVVSMQVLHSWKSDLELV